MRSLAAQPGEGPSQPRAPGVEHVVAHLRAAMGEVPEQGRTRRRIRIVDTRIEGESWTDGGQVLHVSAWEAA